MNKVYLIGNLTRDPELSETTGGVAYCRFAIAVNRTFVNADGTRDADFFNITGYSRCSIFRYDFFRVLRL